MNLIEVRNVSKAFPIGLFGQRVVLDTIDLTVQQGDFVVLRGVNGAGKSTLLKIILGLQEPDNGSVQLCGASPLTPESKLHVGTVFQEVTPPNSLKVKELIEMVRCYYPHPLSTQEMLETVGLTDQQNAFPNDLAGGQKQRLYFAIALVGNPKLLILDEPTKNLDVEGQNSFWTQIETLKKQGVTILIITHIQSDQDKLQDLATHIATLTDGKLTYNKQPDPTALRIAPATTLPRLTANPFRVLLTQTWLEILQLLRTPTYLAGVFLFSALAALLPNDPQSASISQELTFFSAMSLLLFSVDRLGKRIAIERVEGWLKLLRVTPLPPSIYVIAKLMMTMTVLISSLVTIFAIGIFKFHLRQPPTQWLTLSSGLLLGIIPFAILGIALGYIISPKALDSIAGLLIPLGVFSSGLMPIQHPSYLKDLIVLSPFFHYREVIQCATEMKDDHHLLLHILWLTLYSIIAGLVAKFAYQRDRIAL